MDSNALILFEGWLWMSDWIVEYTYISCH